jgi:Flp pilus assembly protein TadD
MALGIAMTVLATGLAAGCGAGATAGRPDTFAARKALAEQLARRDDLAAAYQTVVALHRERPRDAEVLALRGTILREKGLLAEAEADLKEALALDKRLARAHAALGIVYDMTQRGEQAQAAHSRAIQLEPQVAGHLNNLGFSLFLRGRTKEAITTYLKAARLEPLNRRVRNNLGFAYAKDGDLTRAAREFALGGSPAEARNNLGYAYELRGDLNRAFGLYCEALRLDPRIARARKNLAFVAAELGRPVPKDLAGEPRVVTENEKRR